MPFKKIKKDLTDYMYDHPALRVTLSYIVTILAAALSAFIYAYSYKTFVAPPNVEGATAFVTGGAGGASQVIVKICEICGMDSNYTIGNTTLGYIIQSACYVMINAPLAVLAFRKIGKQFTLFTAINIGFYFLFVNIIPIDLCTMFYDKAATTYGVELNLFERSLFAGLCTGISVAIAVKAGHSSGGTDILSMYVTLKNPNASFGRVSLLINSVILATYTILNMIEIKSVLYITMIMYSLVYLFVNSTVVDKIVVKNRKSQIQIITENKNLPDMLISYFPHSATIIEGKGAYTKENKLVVYTVVSEKEVKQALKIIRQIDEKAFVVVTKVSALEGRFYVDPQK